MCKAVEDMGVQVESTLPAMVQWPKSQSPLLPLPKVSFDPNPNICFVFHQQHIIPRSELVFG